MKILTAKTYIKHIKNVMVYDDAKGSNIRKDHPVIVRGKKSEKLLMVHKLMDSEGCYVIENNHPAKKKALNWYYEQN